jgi:hypothetical protein
MAKLLHATVIVAVMLGWAGLARAGLYNPRELKDLYPVPGFDQFQITWSNVRGLARQTASPKPDGSTEKDQPKENDWIRQYRARFNELVAAEKAGSLTLADRIELGASYLRFPSPDGSFRSAEAIRVLEAALAQDPKNFMALANLAIAHQLAGNLERAVSYEGLALEAWPDTYPGFTLDQLRWYRRAEKYYNLLLMLRLREMEQPRSQEKTVDQIFAPVDLVRAEGGYEIGHISARQLAELPPDAVAIVEQLLYWLPLDNRLYWLLGELLNAKGNVYSAYQVFNTVISPPDQPNKTDQTFVKQPDQPRLLRQHWKLLGEDPRAKTEPKLEDLTETSTPKETSGSKTDSSWLPDPRALGVGFAAGVLVTLLAGLQLREIRRRRESGAGDPPIGGG